jgi:thiamine-phosphate diphosphorylase
MSVVPRLHLISNREICPIARFPALARDAVAGGIEAVHLREPGLGDDELLDLAERTICALETTGARTLINRNVDVAAESHAGGVHLPEASIDALPKVRGRFDRDVLIGASIHSVEAAISAALGGADYIIAGHVVETGSKPGTPGRGLSFVEEVSSAVAIPVIAIGGITPQNASDVLRVGAHGVAVLSGILAADDPRDVASQYMRAMRLDEDRR